MLNTLKVSKYSRFNKDPAAIDENLFNPDCDLNEIRLLIDYKYCITFVQYKEVGFDWFFF